MQHYIVVANESTETSLSTFCKYVPVTQNFM